MILTLEGKNKIRLAFRYDPALVEWVKGVPGREFVAAGKFWTVPLRALLRVLDDQGHIVQMDYAVLDAYDRPVQMDEAAVWQLVKPLLLEGHTLWLTRDGVSLEGPAATMVTVGLLNSNRALVRQICLSGRYPVRQGEARPVPQRTVMAQRLREAKVQAPVVEYVRPAWVDEVFVIDGQMAMFGEER